MRFSLGKVSTFNDFSQDFIRGSVRQDFIRFRCNIVKQVGEFDKNVNKITKDWHQQAGKNTTFSQRTLKVFLSKWGGPAAATLQRNTSILGLGDTWWTEVIHGER